LSGNTERHPVSLTQHEIRAPRRARGRRGIWRTNRETDLKTDTEL
jgi:hypothetical protein